MRLLCLADIHGAGLRAVLPELAAVDLVIVAGDVTQLGGGRESEAVLGPLLEAGARVLGVGGNMDRPGARQYLADRRIDIHGHATIIDGIGFFGLGGGTPSPFHTPWEATDEEAAGLLAAAYAEAAAAPRRVLVSHAPPHDTTIDLVRPGLHAGSRAVRDFLLSHPVDLCICGHIHEAGGRETDLDRCHCVNVGPYRAGRYALITIDGSNLSVTWRNI